MRFVYLCDRMALAPRLARLHHAEWRPLLKAWTQADALAELRTHTAHCAIPTTLLAIDDEDALIGSVSLLQNDDDRIRDYSPWLASLYVLADYRGNGHGVALVSRCVEEARALNVPRLHLYTEGQRAFYEKLGWHAIDNVPLGSARVHVMAIDPASTAISQ